MTSSEGVIKQQQIWLMLLFSQAALAVKSLSQAGIPCMLLKGGAGLLAGWLKVEDRPITDIDRLDSSGAAKGRSAHSCHRGLEPGLPALSAL